MSPKSYLCSFQPQMLIEPWIFTLCKNIISHSVNTRARSLAERCICNYANTSAAILSVTPTIQMPQRLTSIKGDAIDLSLTYINNL